MTIELRAGGYRLLLDPARGGSIARFAWNGEALMRATCGPSILDTACFPLVPFCNRIAHGRFVADGRAVALAPNFPGSDHPHTLHGFGWQAAWEVAEAGEHHAILRHRHPAGAWPWAYSAEQSFTLSDGGLRHALSLRNEGDAPMPAGLGAHPYFPRTGETLYRGLHRGEWSTAPDGLPIALREAPAPVDWWHGRPVATRTVDTVYTGRDGPLELTWPDRDLRLTITPSSSLPFTTVYVPAGEAYLCVEPVSHMTDAANRPGAATGLRWIAPDEAMDVSIGYAASRPARR